MSDVLQFQLRPEQEKPLEQLGAAFESLAASYIAEHKGEGQKAGLAQDLMRMAFQKCISCRAEDRVVNIAAIEFCPDEECPLHKFNSKIAAGVMIITGDKQVLHDDRH
ncbi:MAG: hypothetical protein LBS31_10950 [Candidatus Adiutrix sp.]|jgi:hypothetical protein|nr:hypothetical protein [Candidatus Adiutrix sp.]